MSAAATCALVIALEEERRRNDPDYVPLLTVGDLMDCPWAMWMLVAFAVLWSAAMFYIGMS